MMAIKTDSEPLRPAEPSRADNLRGALFMLAGMFVFAAVDAMAKYTTDYLPSLQIFWARYLGLILGVVFLIGFRGFINMKSRHRPLQLARGVAAAMSLLAALGEILVIRALEVGLAVFVSPLHYTIIIWASLYGFLLFGQFPDVWTWTGAAIITASGLYVMHRERVRRDSDD